MNNRGFQQHQNNMRRTQQAADQSRRTRENMQRQQDAAQRARENSRRMQQHGQPSAGGSCLGYFVTLLIVVYLVYLFSYMH